jgi:hypothetical protein
MLIDPARKYNFSHMDNQDSSLTPNLEFTSDGTTTPEYALDVDGGQRTMDVSEDNSALDVQQGEGDHYKRWSIQPITFIHENSLGFARGNIIKYIMRHDTKNGREDLEKAKHYIDLLIELEYDQNEVSDSIGSDDSGQRSAAATGDGHGE